MLYLLLIHSEDAYYERLPVEQHRALMERFYALKDEMERAGVWRGSHRLRPVITATTMRVRDGKVLLVDGPFAETKEQFDGYVLIDVPGLDEALAWARRIPAVDYGSVEIRPIWEPPYV